MSKPTLAQMQAIAAALAAAGSLGVTPRELLAYSLMESARANVDGDVAEFFRAGMEDCTAPATLGQEVYEIAARMAESL